jgi:hypothetical protein
MRGWKLRGAIEPDTAVHATAPPCVVVVQST